MMMSKFKRMSKMDTTEPSVDEVKMKNGGMAKKKMASGGALNRVMIPEAVPSAAERMAAMRLGGGRLLQGRAMKPSAGIPDIAMRKNGGMMKMKAGGLDGDGDVIDYEPHVKGETGNIRGKGYKKGGKAMMDKEAMKKIMEIDKKSDKKMMSMMKKADGGKISDFPETRMVTAKQRKSIDSKTGGIKLAGYKKGGAIKEFENTKVVEKTRPVKLGTGEIKQSPAGYKKGGMVDHGGHKMMGEMAHGHHMMRDMEHEKEYKPMNRMKMGGSVKKCNW